MSTLLLGCVSKSTYQEVSQKADRLEENLSSTEQKLNRLRAEVKTTEQKLQDLQDQKENQEKLIQSLRKEVEAGDVQISRMKDRLTVNLVDKILFDSGEAEISDSGRDTLNRVASVLRETSNKEILVYGHTDNVPIGPKIKDKFETNWELSTARATSVVRFLADKNVSEENLMAAGHAEFDPIASNETSEGRQKNRRIEIVLVPEEIAKPSSKS